LPGRTARCTAVCAVAAFAALVAAAPAWAHGRQATLALDYRLTLGLKPAGVRVAILDGDRALRLGLGSARRAVVYGDLGEPMLRFDDGVWVNLASPTAQANRLVTTPGRGWRRLASGRSFAWHEHRLAPPPYVNGVYGPVAQWTLPVTVDGRHARVGGSFVRLRRPRWWLWLGGTMAAVAAAVVLVRRRPRAATAVAVSAVGVAGIAAVVSQTAFVLRDSPTGRLSWIGIGVGVGVAAGCLAFVAIGRGVERAYAAAAVGAGIAALTLSWLGVFFHGGIVAALPGDAIRAGCALALGGGLVALTGALKVAG
jgi:hypothetical protein